MEGHTTIRLDVRSSLGHNRLREKTGAEHLKWYMFHAAQWVAQQAIARLERTRGVTTPQESMESRAFFFSFGSSLTLHPCTWREMRKSDRDQVHQDPPWTETIYTLGHRWFSCIFY